MKTPKRPAKKAAPVAPIKHYTKDSGKLVLANVAYNAADRKKPAKDASENTIAQAASKKKQAAT